MQQQKFDADYFEQKYQKELQEHREKQQTREKLKQQRELDPANCYFAPNLAPRTGAITARATARG